MEGKTRFPSLSSQINTVLSKRSLPDELSNSYYIFERIKYPLSSTEPSKKFFSHKCPLLHHRSELVIIEGRISNTFSLSRKYHNAHLYRAHRYRLVLVRIRGKYACIPETCVHERVNEREKNFFVDRVTREKLFFLFPLSFSFRSFFPLLLRISLLSTFKLTRTLLLEGLSYGVSCELTDLGDQF